MLVINLLVGEPPFFSQANLMIHVILKVLQIILHSPSGVSNNLSN